MTATLSKADQSAFEAILAGAVAAGVTPQNIDVLKACAGAVSIETLRTMAAGFMANKPGGKPLGLVVASFIRQNDTKNGKKGSTGYNFVLQGPFYPYPSFNREKLTALVKFVKDGTAERLLAEDKNVQ